MKQLEWATNLAITYQFPADSSLLAQGELQFGGESRPFNVFARGERFFLTLGQNEQGLYGACFWAFPPNVIDRHGRYISEPARDIRAYQLHSVID